MAPDTEQQTPDEHAASDQRLITIGRIAGAQGIKGWLKIHSYTKPREAILAYKRWELTTATGQRSAELVDGRRQGKKIVALLAGCEDRDAAEAMVGQDIAVARGDLPAIEDGEYYWADLEGLAVVATTGEQMGQVAYLIETGANDVLVVTRQPEGAESSENGKKEILIPFVTGEIVKAVDHAAGTITVDWEWD